MNPPKSQPAGIAGNWTELAQLCALKKLSPSDTVAKLVALMELQFASLNPEAFLRSDEKWRFTLNPIINPSGGLRRLEKCLEKRLASVAEQLAPETWANQVPASSGLATKSGSTGSENIDIVRRIAPHSYQFIELKVAPGRTGSLNTPAYAAIELTKYAALYFLTRRYLAERLPHHVPTELLKATHTTWCVLAPSSFYSRPMEHRIDRETFAKDVETALRSVLIGAQQTRFRFCMFPASFDPQTEDEIRAVDGELLLKLVEEALDEHRA